VQGAEHAGHIAEDLAELGRVFSRKSGYLGGVISEGDRVVGLGADAAEVRGKPNGVMRGRPRAIFVFPGGIGVEILQSDLFADGCSRPVHAFDGDVHQIAAATYGQDAGLCAKDFADASTIYSAGVGEHRVDFEGVVTVGDGDGAAVAGSFVVRLVGRRDGPAGTEPDAEILVLEGAGVVRCICWLRVG